MEDTRAILEMPLVFKKERKKKGGGEEISYTYIYIYICVCRLYACGCSCGDTAFTIYMYVPSRGITLAPFRCLEWNQPRPINTCRPVEMEMPTAKKLTALDSRLIRLACQSDRREGGVVGRIGSQGARCTIASPARQSEMTK